MKHHLLSMALVAFLASCIPEWEPIETADDIYHRNDTLSLNLSIRVTRSNQQFVDTLAVVGRYFDLFLSAYPDRGLGTLYVFDERDSILLTWSFMNSDHRKKTFDRRPFRTILSLREYTGNVYLHVYGRMR